MKQRKSGPGGLADKDLCCEHGLANSDILEVDETEKLIRLSTLDPRVNKMLRLQTPSASLVVEYRDNFLYTPLPHWVK